MRLKHLFHRKTKGSGSPAPELSGRCEANAPPAQTEDLQKAWAELKLWKYSLGLEERHWWQRLSCWSSGC